jgi:iron complex outermembrane recepter protein
MMSENKISRFMIALAFGLGLACPTQAQFRLSGQVSGRDQGQTEPLAGANVWLKGTNRGATTDRSGSFQVERVPAGSYTLVVSFIGYRPEERAVELGADLEVSFVLEATPVLEAGVTVSAARYLPPFTKTDISRAELAKQNLGQDLPILLNFTPSIVTTSDAGAGVGYTGLRIRGSDPTRINVTLNGIPLNGQWGGGLRGQRQHSHQRARRPGRGGAQQLVWLVQHVEAQRHRPLGAAQPAVQVQRPAVQDHFRRVY